MVIEQVDRTVVTQGPAVVAGQILELVLIWAVGMFRREPV